jgi:hypothetical protein
MHHPDEQAHFYLLSIDYAIDKTFVFSNRPTGISIALPKSLGKPVPADALHQAGQLIAVIENYRRGKMPYSAIDTSTSGKVKAGRTPTERQRKVGSAFTSSGAAKRLSSSFVASCRTKGGT